MCNHAQQHHNFVSRVSFTSEVCPFSSFGCLEPFFSHRERSHISDVFQDLRAAVKDLFLLRWLWRGTGGREPGRTGGGRGTGDGRRKGGKRDLYDGGKRERNSKRQAFVNCYCSSSSQRNEPNNVS